MISSEERLNFFKLLLVMMMLSTVYGNAIEINTAIESGADDVEERASGRISLNSGDLELIDDAGKQTVGLRFVNLDIPQGANIISAYMQFTVDEVSTTPTVLNIYGEKVANASVFTTASKNVSLRTKTTATTSWNVPIWETTKVSDLAQRTPELKEVLQEIVNLADWTANNSMVFIVEGLGKRVADSYEGGLSRAPKLYVNYETNSSVPVDTNNTNLATNAVIDTAISDNYDDAEEFENGTVSRGSSDLELVYDGTYQTVGMRFRALDIPKGARITNAYLKFTTDERDSQNTDLNIYAEKSASPLPYESVQFNISSRTKTSASVAWNVPAWNTTLETGVNQTSPNLKVLVQEVIDLENWTENSDMAFMINGTGKRVADSYEGGASRATKLHIEFTIASTDVNNSNGTIDNNSSNGTIDSNTTNDGVDTNTTTGGGTDSNSTNGGVDNNTSLGGGTDTNQTLVFRSLDISVNLGNDDVEESAWGDMYMNSSDLELVQELTEQSIGLRFTSLNIPKGATVTSAYIQFNTDEIGHDGTTILNIYAENSDNALVFSPTAYNVSSRLKTTASAIWDVPLWTVLNEQGTVQQTPELKDLVQEVVNRSGWTEASALAFIIQGTGKRTADSYEGGPAKAPKLHVSYEFYQDPIFINPRVTTFVEDSTANVLNPDRGLYTADFDLAGVTDYSIFFDPQAAGYRMVYAPINLYDYANTTTLPNIVLDTIDGHLADAEAKGVKLILRFKYRPNESTAYQDPALSTILGHMEQLRTILQNHKEIISVIQAGTIGAWGEWNRLTGEFADTDNNYRSNRRAVISKLVDIFPNKFIQIRTPMHKELLYGTSAVYKDEGIEGQITADSAFTSDIRAKIGHHNDCLLVNEGNYGTYGTNIEFWKDYVANDAKYAPVGGETCGVDNSSVAYLTDCTYAVSELKRLQYSYLNNVYHQDVLDKWKAQGCYTEIKENLGYRLVATHLDTIKSDDNSTLAISLNLENKGFSAPYIKSNVNFILKNSFNTYVFTQAGIDMRKFYASEISNISDDLALVDVETGEYCLYLQMGESFSAIRLSNSRNSDGIDMWDESLKMNMLKCGIQL